MNAFRLFIFKIIQIEICLVINSIHFTIVPSYIPYGKWLTKQYEKVKKKGLQKLVLIQIQVRVVSFHISSLCIYGL